MSFSGSDLVVNCVVSSLSLHSYLTSYKEEVNILESLETGNRFHIGHPLFILFFSVLFLLLNNHGIVLKEFALIFSFICFVLRCHTDVLVLQN